MIHVTLRQLEVFAAAAEALSFARVAERLRLTPSAVSFQIRQVEGAVGVALFERIGRRVTLTDAGAVLRDYAAGVLGGMRDLDQAMAAFQGVSGGRVRLGLVSTAKYIVPHLIARFSALYPGVSVQLREGNRTHIVTQLLAGTIDLAIMGQPPDDTHVVAERFAPHPSVLIAPAGHPLLGHALTPRDIVGESFVIREQGSGTRALSDQFFRAAGFAPRVALETSSNEMIKQFVMAGMGLAVISRHTISLELAMGLLDTLTLDGFPVLRAWFVVQRRTAPLLPVQAALRTFLLRDGQAVIEELSAGGMAGFVRPTSTPRPGGRQRAAAR